MLSLLFLSLVWTGFAVAATPSEAIYHPACPTDAPINFYQQLYFNEYNHIANADGCDQLCQGFDRCIGYWHWPGATTCGLIYVNSPPADPNSFFNGRTSGVDCDDTNPDEANLVIGWNFASVQDVNMDRKCAAGTQYIDITGACTACPAASTTNDSGRGCNNLSSSQLVAGQAKRIRQRRHARAMREAGLASR